MDVIARRPPDGQPWAPPPPRPAMRHIRIVLGTLVLDFQACAEQARDVATEIARRTRLDLIVTVDDHVSADLPPLPCARLWAQ
ncbi:hypothetical protein IU436_10020 [Nocardia farcinica]|uniref:Uncharacterized protein n=1 Tax=Nocardia farcinica TaxID=37329 RepID=A0A0H5PJR4_NOCFR|nr:hypothetical protein [Nocardia farcinica]MBF6069257.1 hypothetical protein [Nocardia farcinica]MBF6143321.1 hypothetical protein [Nocardia farcinica]MBF6259955.1 hypothetical protein [Nocardia farcinica]MBF6295813.1 hypothetical protein [Nocardia farcinica]MBF6376504.1 hypothetical protein [Nocardia farcinica]